MGRAGPLGVQTSPWPRITSERWPIVRKASLQGLYVSHLFRACEDQKVTKIKQKELPPPTAILPSAHLHSGSHSRGRCTGELSATEFVLVSSVFFPLRNSISASSPFWTRKEAASTAAVMHKP